MIRLVRAQSAPDTTRVTALKIYATEQNLVEALHTWQPDGGYIQPPVRTSATTQNRNDIGLKIRTLTFTTAWTETEHFVLQN